MSVENAQAEQQNIAEKAKAKAEEFLENPEDRAQVITTYGERIDKHLGQLTQLMESPNKDLQTVGRKAEVFLLKSISDEHTAFDRLHKDLVDPGASLIEQASLFNTLIEKRIHGFEKHVEIATLAKVEHEKIQAEEREVLEKTEAQREELESLETPEDEFNESNLRTPAGTYLELQKFDTQNKLFRRDIIRLDKVFKSFYSEYKKLEESKKDWGVFLRGSPWEEDEKTAELREQRRYLKMSIQATKKRLVENQQRLSDYGNKLKESGTAQKTRYTEEYNKGIEKANEHDAQVGESLRSNEEQYQRIDTQQKELRKQQDKITSFQTDLQEQINDSLKFRQEIRIKGKQLMEFESSAKTILIHLDEALSNDLPEEKKAELKSFRNKLSASKKMAGDRIGEIASGLEDIAFAGEESKRKIMSTENSRISIQDYLDTAINPTLDGLSESISLLEIEKLKNGTPQEQMQAQYQEIIGTVEMIDKVVVENTKQNLRSNEAILSRFEEQTKSIDNLKITAPSLWDATGGLFLGKTGKLLSLTSTGIDYISNGLKDAAKDIPVLNVVTDIVTGVNLDVLSGIVEGAGELVSGVGTMIGHPLDTIKGIGILIGRDPQTGEWSFSNAGNGWLEMGKFLIASENFEKGEYGKGVGKILLNILLTATGAGAASDGANGAAIAFRMAKAGISKAMIKASWMGTKIFFVKIGRALKSLPKGIGKAAKNIIGSPKRIGKFLINKSKGIIKGKTFRLDQKLATMQASLKATTSELEKMTIGGQQASAIRELAGKTYKQVRTMSGSELAKLGLTDANSMLEFLEYSKTLKASAQLKEAINTIRCQKIAEFSKTIPVKIQEAQAGIKAAELEVKTAEANFTAELRLSYDAVENEATFARTQLETAQKGLETAEKRLKGLEKARDTISEISSGTINNFNNYAGIRNLAKNTGLSQDDAYVLAEQLLHNSGKTISDLIRIEDTVGELTSIDISGTITELVESTEGVETVLTKLDDARSLEDMNKIISGIKNPAERNLLQSLSNDLIRKGENALEAAEKTTILKESMRYLRDYKAALKEGEIGTITRSQELFDLIRRNQRELAHQTIIDRNYFTGSDHGITHILEGNMAIADKIFADMGQRISANQRLLIRQSLIDHDMGYTINALKKLKNDDVYFALTKDHPLYSTAWCEINSAMYVKHFGEEGFATIREAILNHSDASAFNLRARGSQLVKNIVAAVDCLGVTADIKMMKLFRNPEMMAQMLKLKDLADNLSTAVAAARKGLIEEVGVVKKLMSEYITKMNINPALKKSYLRALEFNLDPMKPGFAAIRDFGSHSAGFEGIAVAEDLSFTVNMNINKNFSLVRAMFQRGDDVSTGALAKVLDDYGLTIKDGKTPVATVIRDGTETTAKYSQRQFAHDLALVEKGELTTLSVRTERATFNITMNAEKGKELAQVLEREAALREAIETLNQPKIVKEIATEVIHNLTEAYNWDEYLMIGGESAKSVLSKIDSLLLKRKYKEAGDLLRKLRFRGIGGSG